MKTLEQLNIHNQFITLGSDFYTKLPPTPLRNARVAASNPDAAALLNLAPAELQRPQFLQYFSGQQLHPKFDPLAMVYSGHQFGSYNPQLGDGRGLLLGEVINDKQEHWDIHLKGAGETPYSRFGDGRAVLRSCIREYLGSEALHHLGIPTTRALCIFSSDEPVARETMETGAAMIRLSPSHIRFGHFEYFYYNQKYEHIKILADHVIQRHYPSFMDSDNPYLALITQVIQSTATMVAKWQVFGFAHGVMNTDNMSILGLTFDYGPFGFMEEFNPTYICNHSDHNGRYAFHKQPSIALWNLHALAQTFIKLVPQQSLLDALQKFESQLLSEYHRSMFDKIGLTEATPEDTVLIQQLITVLTDNHAEYTGFFRQLCDFKSNESNQNIIDTFINRDQIQSWLAQYNARLNQQQESDTQRSLRMKRKNPKYILKNYLAQNAIEAAMNGNFDEVETLTNILRTPFDEQSEFERYAAPTPDWGKQMVISCSS